MFSKEFDITTSEQITVECPYCRYETIVQLQSEAAFCIVSCKNDDRDCGQPFVFSLSTVSYRGGTTRLALVECLQIESMSGAKFKGVRDRGFDWGGGITIPNFA